ncbi:hypothetical protein KR074_007655, partial [Drosophila pseudoananassae]
FGTSKFDIRLESVESINGDEETLIDFDLKLVGRERAINGTVKTLVVFDERVIVHGRHYKFKNGNWVESNIKVDLTGCDSFASFLNQYYKSFLQYYPDPICPLPVGKYPVINARLSSDNWPNFITSGLSAAVLIYEKDYKTFGGIRIQFNLIDKK